MKIDRIQISSLTLQLGRPMSTAYGVFSSQDILLVRLYANNGLCGFGEVPVGGTMNYGGFSRESVATDIAGHAKRFIDREFAKPLELLDALDRPISRSQEEREISSKAPLDMAIHDLQGKVDSKPLFELFGSARRNELEVGHILSAESPSDMAEEASNYFRGGCGSFKVKLSGNLAENRMRIECIRQTVGDRVVLWADANEQWSADETIRWCRSLGDNRIDYIEQPVPGWDLEGLAKVRTEIQPTKVIADQSAYSIHDAKKIVKMKAADIITIKTMRLGASKAARVAEICAENDVGCKIGAGGEGAIGAAVAIHVSRIAPTLADCNELSFPRYASVPFEGLGHGTRREWTWKVEPGPGLGVAPKSTCRDEPVLVLQN